jgi:hypothetical protein
MKGAPSSCISPARMGMGSLGPVEVKDREAFWRKVLSKMGKLGGFSTCEI